MFRKRRQLVFGALGVSALAAAAWRYWPEHGFANPCRARLPDKLAHHEIVRAAWDGIDAAPVTQLNRAGPALARLLERDDWHTRLLNGSDYPLPGIMPLYSMDYLVELRVIEPPLAPVLAAIREHNPLLFDFALKRHLRAGGKGFPARVFETQPFFAR